MTDHTEMQIPDPHELAVRIFYEEFGMDAPRNKAVNAIERAIIMERRRQSSAMTPEIPYDVQKTADEVARKVGAIWDIEPIARTILAERERCARIAESHLNGRVVSAKIRSVDK